MDLLPTPEQDEIITTVRAIDPTAHVVETAMSDVRGTDPRVTQHLVVLVADAVEDSASLRAQITTALAVQVTAHVAWSLARGDGAGERGGGDRFKRRAVMAA